MVEELLQLTVEFGVNGIGYDDDKVLPVGDGGGGGDEHDEEEEDDDDEEEDDDDESVLRVSGADGDAAGAAAPVVGWIEFSLWPRWVMRLAPNATSNPGVAARHRDTSDAQRV